MKIATWNINGVKARIDGAVTWLKEAEPDVACFQEIKTRDEAFPAAPFEALGYNVAVHGQKGFNGVAILSRRPFDEIAVRGLPGDDGDAHARYIEVCVPRAGGVVRVGNLYLPNGNPIGTDKFAYKLAWMKRFETRTRELLGLEEPFLLLGDYNVIPEPVDARNPPPGPEMRSTSPRPALPSARSSTSASRTRCAPACPSPASTRSGTIRRAPGRRTTASASTTSWPRRRRPTASSRPASTSTRAPGRSRPTTCRCGWICRSRGGAVAPCSTGVHWIGSTSSSRSEQSLLSHCIARRGGT